MFRKIRRCLRKTDLRQRRAATPSQLRGAVFLGNKGASALGATPLTEAGETLTSDVIKSFVPKVEVPKKKEE